MFVVLTCFSLVARQKSSSVLFCLLSCDHFFFSVYFGKNWLYTGCDNRTAKVWWAPTRLGWTNTWKWMWGKEGFFVCGCKYWKFWHLLLLFCTVVKVRHCTSQSFAFLHGSCCSSVIAYKGCGCWAYPCPHPPVAGTTYRSLEVLIYSLEAGLAPENISWYRMEVILQKSYLLFSVAVCLWIC